MSARTSRIPEPRLHKASGQAVVTLNGRDLYLGKFDTDKSKAEYDRITSEWLANGRTLTVACSGVPADITINELLVAYLRHADGYYLKNGKPTTEPQSIRLSIRPLRRLYGHTPARDFGPLALKTVRAEMVNSGLCLNEVNKRTRRIVRAVGWAVEEELIPGEVHYRLRVVKGFRKGRSQVRESEPVKTVPQAFVDAIRPFVSRQIWAMIELQSESAMRPGEVCQMRSADVDRSGTTWKYVPRSHKTEHHGKPRTVYLNARAREILRPWLREDPDAYLFSPRAAFEEQSAERRAHRKTPLTPSQRSRVRKTQPKRTPGEFYVPRSYCHAIRRGCKKAGVPHWHPHQLRHNAATRYWNEFRPEIARIFLGHSSLAMTKVYAEVDDAKALAAMELLN